MLCTLPLIGPELQGGSNSAPQLWGFRAPGISSFVLGPKFWAAQPGHLNSSLYIILSAGNNYIIQTDKIYILLSTRGSQIAPLGSLFFCIEHRGHTRLPKSLTSHDVDMEKAIRERVDFCPSQGNEGSVLARAASVAKKEVRWLHKMQRPGGVLDCWSRVKLIYFKSCWFLRHVISDIFYS